MVTLRLLVRCPQFTGPAFLQESIMPKKLSNVLTPLTVKNAKPGRHADGGGLHLLVK